jgi:5'-3' exonuclease
MHYLFFDYFQKIIVPAWQESSGINCHKVEAAEGDDIIAGLCERSDDDSVIYSVDHDLKQLVTGSGKNVVLILPKQMHKFKRLISPSNLFRPEPVSESRLDDFFSLDSLDQPSPIEKIIRSLKEKDYVEQEVDVIDEILTKILLGDKSDNVPKISGLAPVKASKIISAIKSNFEFPLAMLDAFDDAFICFCVDQIGIVTKTKDQSILDHIKQHLIFNIRILRLSTQVFPEKVREALASHLDSYTTAKFNPKGFYDLKNNQTCL